MTTPDTTPPVDIPALPVALPAGLVLYFGCYDAADHGHFLYAPEGRHANQYDLPESLSTRRLDGSFCPQVRELPRQAEGIVKLTHVGADAKAYTVLAFWDRSGDPRPNSHSTFVVRGKYHYHDALRLCRAIFPELFARLEARKVRLVPLS